MADGAPCGAVRPRLAAMADGTLPAAEEGRLRAHLEGCAACRAELAALEALRDRLRALPPEPLPPGFAERLRRRLAVAESPEGPRWRGMTMPLAAAAAGFLAAAVLAAPLVREAPPPRAVLGVASRGGGTPAATFAVPATRAAPAALPSAAAAVPSPDGADLTFAAPAAPGPSPAPAALAIALLTREPARVLSMLRQAVAAAGGTLVETLQPAARPAAGRGTAPAPRLAGTADAVLPALDAARVARALDRYGGELAAVGDVQALQAAGSGGLARLLVAVFAPAAGPPAPAAARPVSPRRALATSLAGVRQDARAVLAAGAWAAPWAALGGCLGLIAWAAAAVVRRARSGL